VAVDEPAVLDYLSVTLSHPRWLVKRWLGRYGFAGAEAWARFNNTVAPLTLRTNTLITDVDGLAAQLVALGVGVRRTDRAPDGLVVTAGNPLHTPLAGSGRFVIQDEASQLVSLMVGARPGERVLDTCASPGGKTVAIAGAMRNRGLLVAGDARPRRLELLAQTVTLARATCVRVVQLDLDNQLPFRAVFDRVLVDVPCSGLGTIRRDPEIRWRRHEEDLHRFAARQRIMLAHAAQAVVPGGWLVYATCSSEPEENEEVVSGFLAEHAGFSALDRRQADSVLPPCLLGLLSDEVHLRTEPGRDHLEAFFTAVMCRTR
jgi:16S rRNA (cytosine967-C5)-methyltransferase